MITSYTVYFTPSPKGEQAHWRTRLQRAYRQPTYAQARKTLAQLQRDLEGRNQSATRGLAEGLEETLTLHRLGVFPLLGESFKTTNCLESINALSPCVVPRSTTG